MTRGMYEIVPISGREERPSITVMGTSNDAKLAAIRTLLSDDITGVKILGFNNDGSLYEETR